MRSVFKASSIILLISISGILTGQVYNHSAGVRAGFSSGITYKGFFNPVAAAGIDALYSRHGLNISAMYEYHIAPFRNERYQFYTGGGLFGGEWDSEFSLGICGIAGFEFIIRDLPIILSADWKPLFNAIKQTSFEPLDFGISIRYRFEI